MIIFLGVLLSLINSFALVAQVADQATLDRYLNWENTQPPNGSWDQKEFLAHYRAKIEAEGLSPSAAARMVASLSKRLDADEAAFWSKNYSNATPGFKTTPNQLLVNAVRGVKPGRALDVEMGQGRNAVFLAQQGWEVTGFDFSDKALALAQEQAKKAGVNLQTVLAKDEDFDFGKEQWDLIAILYPMEKRSFARARDALKPGGLIVVEGFHKDVHGPAVRYNSNELLERFAGYRILYYEDGVSMADWGKREQRLVKLVAQKPIDVKDKS